MVGDVAKAMFPHVIDVPYFATITSHMHFTFWAWDFLDCFEGILKKAGAYDVIWGYRFKQPSNLGLLKAYIAQWSPNTNTTMTYYWDLGISL